MASGRLADHKPERGTAPSRRAPVAARRIWRPVADRPSFQGYERCGRRRIAGVLLIVQAGSAPGWCEHPAEAGGRLGDAFDRLRGGGRWLRIGRCSSCGRWGREHPVDCEGEVIAPVGSAPWWCEHPTETGGRPGDAFGSATRGRSLFANRASLRGCGLRSRGHPVDCEGELVAPAVSKRRGREPPADAADGLAGSRWCWPRRCGLRTSAWFRNFARCDGRGRRHPPDCVGEIAATTGSAPWGASLMRTVGILSIVQANWVRRMCPRDGGSSLLRRQACGLAGRRWGWPRRCNLRTSAWFGN